MNIWIENQNLQHRLCSVQFAHNVQFDEIETFVFTIKFEFN